MSDSLFPADAEVEQLLLGPESVAWQRSSDLRLYLVMLYPLLLQVAHPTVGAGVHDFSDFEHRPWDRLWRTLDYVNLLVYGGAGAAPAGKRLRALHKGFRGTRQDGKPYYALEPEAYAWVHATLIATYVQGHAQFGKPMTSGQVERFYGEYRGLGRLIGVREHDLPRDWSHFQAYFERVVESELTRTDSVDRVLGAIAHAPAPLPLPDLIWGAVRLPAARALWLGGVGLTAPTLRKKLGIRWTPFDELAFRSLGALTRSSQPLLPKRLQVLGPAHLRWREAEIAQGPLGAQLAN